MATQSPDLRRMQARRSLVSVAAALLAEHGLEQLRMADVAKQANLPVSSLYVHFESKDALVSAIIADALERHRPTFSEAKNATAAVDRVFAFGLAVLDVAIHEPTVVRAMQQRALQGIPNPPHVGFDDWPAQLQVDVSSAIRDGDLPSVPAATVVALLTSLWSGLASRVVERGDLALDAEVAHDAFELGRSSLLAGLDPSTLRPTPDV